MFHTKVFRKRVKHVLLDGDCRQPKKNNGIKFKLQEMMNMGTALFRQTFNDDWHTRLRLALSYAKNRTRSSKILVAIESLEHELKKNDECIHTVTITLPVPPSIDASFLMNQIQENLCTRPATLRRSPNGDIELTITKRGTKEHVTGVAQLILKDSLLNAESKIWAESMVRLGRICV